MNAFGSDCIRALMAQGLDTLAIAERVGCSEAQIWNLLAREGSAPRQTIRLAPVKGHPPETSPAAAAVGGFSPVVVRNEGGEAQGVNEVDFSRDVARQAGGLVVHRFGSGGIGPQ
jgi:hypothetical protein